jgi:hypothetical protein
VPFAVIELYVLEDVVGDGRMLHAVERQALAVEGVVIDQRGLEAADVEIAAAAGVRIDDLNAVGRAVARNVELRAKRRRTGIHPAQAETVEHQLGTAGALHLQHRQLVGRADHVIVAGHGHVAEGQPGAVGVGAVVQRDRAARVADADGRVVGVRAPAVGRQEVAHQREGHVVEHDVGQVGRAAHVEQIAGARAIVDRQIADRGGRQRRRHHHRAVDDDRALVDAGADERDAALEGDRLVVSPGGDRDGVAAARRVDRGLDVREVEGATGPDGPNCHCVSPASLEG